MKQLWFIIFLLILTLWLPGLTQAQSPDEAGPPTAPPNEADYPMLVSRLADRPVITVSLTFDWLPAAGTPPPITNEPGVLKTPGSDSPIQAATVFFDDDDFFYSSDTSLRTASLGAPKFPPDMTQLELSVGANGWAFCPKDSFGRPFCRARDGSRAAAGNNGGQLTPTERERLQRLLRQPTIDEISASILPTANDAERQLLANILKPFGGPTTGRTPMPQANAPQFGNWFNAGVGANNRSVLPLNQTTLQASSLPVTLLGPQFRNQLDSYFNRPGVATQPLAGPALAQPATSPNVPCYAPAGPLTYVTFVNQSYRYALITWVNFACQEINYALIPPGQIYYQQSYLNYSWRVRDAQTLQYVGQVMPTAANPRPLFSIFQASLAVTNGDSATDETISTQTSLLPELGQLSNRFQQLGDQQAALFYSSSQLAALRAERTRLTYYFMYTDPVFIYVEQELEAIYRQIYTTRPSYNYTVNLAAAIDSWTNPPANSSTAKTRFIQRQALALWQDQLENEVGLYLQANPSLAEQLAKVELWLMQRYTAIMESGPVDTTAQDWWQRYTTTYNDGLSPLRAEAAQFMANNPKFKQYVQLRNQIAELLPQFENHPLVDELIFQTAALENNLSLTQAVNQAYSQYPNQVGPVLDQSTFDEESETFYAQLNSLVKNDSTYQQLRNAHTGAMQSVQAYLQNVRAAVANCYTWYGSNCNPYTDPNVQAILNHTLLWQLLAPLAEAHDAHNRYWYAFYQQADYQNLQASAQARMQAAQASVLPLFEQARQQFEQQVKAIPQVQQLEAKLAQAVMVFRGQNQTASLTTTANYPYAELNQKLNQLAQVEGELLGRTGQTVYLPLIQK